MESKRYIPSGFSYTGTAKTVVDRNSRVSVIALIECDACGTQIQSVSRSVGSHRQACPGVRPEDVALDTRLAEARRT